MLTTITYYFNIHEAHKTKQYRNRKPHQTPVSTNKVCHCSPIFNIYGIQHCCFRKFEFCSTANIGEKKNDIVRCRQVLILGLFIPSGIYHPDMIAT